MNQVIKNFYNIQYGPALEDNKEVLKWINQLPKPNQHFINGEWVKSLSIKTLNSINPANNKKLFKLRSLRFKFTEFEYLINSIRSPGAT